MSLACFLSSLGIALDRWHWHSYLVACLISGVLGKSLVHFELIGSITKIETFAVGSAIREIARLRRIYGKGRWRKRKGVAKVRLADGSVHESEIHWYEASTIGRKEYKIKRFLWEVK